MRLSIFFSALAVFLAAPAVWADSGDPAARAIESVKNAGRDQDHCGGWMICFSYDKDSEKTAAVQETASQEAGTQQADARKPSRVPSRD